MPNAAIIIAKGFEEIEATAIIDILRRGKIDLSVVGLDSAEITGAHGIRIIPDTTLAKVANKRFDALILPGGEPGTTNLEASQALADFIKAHVDDNKVIGAICAAPRILDKLGVLNGKQATSYPATKDRMTACDYQELRVVVDGNILTSRGPGTAMLFAYSLLEKLTGESADALKKAMVFDASAD